MAHINGLAGSGDALTKKRKTSHHDGQLERRQRTPGASRIFAPYRTIGLVSPTSVPFTSISLGKTTFQITTSVGRSLQTYDLRRGLNLVFITRPQTPQPITASIAWKDKVIAAWGGDGTTSERGVWAFKRGKREAQLEVPLGFQENVVKFCVFGSWVVGVCQTQLLVWKSDTLELYTNLQGASPMPFTRCIASLPTFLNKIIVGREDGSAEIWNVSSGKLVYTILPPSSAYGAVTAIQPTPALSFVAIAYEAGAIVIQDVRSDQAVITLNGRKGAPVTSISFRTDGQGAGDDGQKSGVMATASLNSGEITFWDLNNGGRKSGVFRAAHADPQTSTPGGVTKVEFLPGQAILVSTGLDNSLKTWIFDASPFSPVPRILHERRGHGAPVTKLEFLPTASDGSDDTGKWLMSGSRDRSLWGWSLRRDGQSTELSQGAIQKKAKKQGLLSGDRDKLDDLKCPPIIHMDCSLNRDGGIGALPGKQPIWQQAKGKQVSAEISAMTGWESVITAHKNDSKARSWFWGRKRAGRWAFPTSDNSNVASVAMSQCGTFAVVGSENGGVDMFNMQSGMHRQRFPARLTPMQAKQLQLDMQKDGLIEDDEGKKKFYRGQGRHTSAVIGLAIDSLNKTVISASTDGKVKFWDFGTGLLQQQIDWSTSTNITAMRFHRGSDLAAFACTDNCIRVVDTTTHKLIRELWPSRTPIPELSQLSLSDFTFSTNGTWITASLSSLILIWDLPTGHLVDAFRLPAPCATLALSPTGEFLATATTASEGVDIWSNRSLFQHISNRHITHSELTALLSDSTSTAQAPTASGENAAALIPTTTTTFNPDEDEDDLDLDLDTGFADIDALTSDLLSLSLIPKPRWQNLMHLDLIRQRNKPLEPPKKPEKAPFFLPSTTTPQQQPQPSTTTASDPPSRLLAPRLTQQSSTFTTLLHTSPNPTNPSSAQQHPALNHLSTLPPAAADLELRSLSRNDLAAFLETLITSQQHQRSDFELGNAWVKVLLAVHGDVFAADDEGGLRRLLGEWAAGAKGERRRVGALVEGVLGLGGWVGAARV
ncbi:hypothetical protein MBLNU230_g1969t1 [Neophaeotheca triangularis]